MRNFFVAVAVVATLMGCGDPKIDGTDKQSFEKSVRKIAESLPQEKRGQFMSDLGVANLLAMEGLSTGHSSAEINAQVLKKLDGKSADEIQQIANAERTRKQAVHDQLEKNDADYRGRCVTTKPGTQAVTSSPDAPPIVPGQVFKVVGANFTNTLTIEEPGGKAYTYPIDGLVLSNETTCGFQQ